MTTDVDWPALVAALAVTEGLSEAGDPERVIGLLVRAAMLDSGIVAPPPR